MTDKKNRSIVTTQSKGETLSIQGLLAFLAIAINGEKGVKVTTYKGTFIQAQNKIDNVHNEIVRFLNGTVVKYFADSKKSGLIDNLSNPIFIKNYLIPDVSTISADALYSFINADAATMKAGKHFALPHVGRTISMTSKIMSLFKPIGVQSVADLDKWLSKFTWKISPKKDDAFPDEFVNAIMPLVWKYNASHDFGFGMSNAEFKQWKRFYPNTIDEEGKIKGGMPSLKDEAYQGNSFNPDLPQLGTYKEQVEALYGKDTETSKRFLIWGLLEGSFIELPEVAEIVSVDGDIKKTIKQAEQKAKKQAELDASVEAFKKAQADKMGL